MKNFDSRTYGVHDFVGWESQKELELNPLFQRRAVWSDKAKSYLMDTILRGKPIPKIFIRQRLNVTTKQSIKEVVDGQQRLRTILSFVRDGFTVSKRMNPEFGGQLFSELPEILQEQVLNYELSVDLLTNLPDSEVLDIFGRLNSYAVVLNEQERINATHFSSFKILADQIGHKYADYWAKQGILTSRQILRMQEVNLVADLLIAMREGIKSKKQIRRYYDTYEKEYDDDVAEVATKFDGVISKIGEIYQEGIAQTEFSRVHLFYSLFTAVAHCLYELPGLGVPHPDLHSTRVVQGARGQLDRVAEWFDPDVQLRDLPPVAQQFLQDSRRATTDEKVRERRTQTLVGLMA